MGGKKSVIIFFLLIMLISSVYAVDTKQIQEKTKEASDIIHSFFDGVGRQNILIVMGDKISLDDKMLFNMMKSQTSEMQGIEIDCDTNVINDEFKKTEKALVLIGGEKTNLVSKDLIPTIKDSKINVLSPVIMVQGFTESGKKIIIIYSEKEVNNNENTAIAKSPLRSLVPDKYIPVVATSMSILLLYLWSVFYKTIAELLNDFISGKLINKFHKRKIKKGEFLNVSEVIAFIITVVVFSLTMSWTWAGENFWDMFFLNLGVVGTITFFRELSRLLFCHKHKLKSELVLWPFGTIITFLSTWLGNTFSMVSYTKLDEDLADEKKFGKSEFVIGLITYLFAVVAFIWNIISPSLILQMSFVYCVMVLFIEMFPMNPMPGADVKKWNIYVWLLFYLVTFVSYIYMNFTLYV